jgi:hypothetical protein
MFRRDELTRDQKRDRAIAAVNRAVADGAEQMDVRDLASRLEDLAVALRGRWATTSSVF